jgi:tetratricopeptide (TPR) repeat protein
MSQLYSTAVTTIHIDGEAAETESVNQATAVRSNIYRWLVCLPAVIVLLLYLPAIGYGLVWDDTIFLRDFSLYRDPVLGLEVLGRPFVFSPNYFRPLALLTFMIELRLVGLNPMIFHLSNLLLHAANTAMVGLLAWHLRPGRTEGEGAAGRWKLPLLPVAAGLLYGLHPALLEGVVFISGRFDLLMTSCLLLALLADVRLRGVARPLLVGLAFLLAALSKEMAVAFALAWPAWRLAIMGLKRPAAAPVVAGVGLRARWWATWQERRQAGDLAVLAAIVLAGVVYLGLRTAALGHLLVGQTGAAIPVGNWLQHLLLIGRSVGEYVLLIGWPFTSLTPIHFSLLPLPAGSLAGWFCLILAGLLIGGLVVLVRRRPVAGWLAVAGVLALLPVWNVLPLELAGGAFAAERFLILPAAFLALAAVSLWPAQPRRTPRLQQGLLVGVGLWLGLSAAAIQLTLPHWQDNLTLWTWAAGRAPLSALPPTNLALEYINRGDYGAGLAAAEQAIRLDAQSGNAWDNAGLALFHQERYAEAQTAFEQAVTLEPANALFWNNLAGALREQGKLAEAERVLLDQSLRLEPTLPVAHMNLGIVYLGAERPDLAAAALQEAARLLPPGQTAEVEALLAQTAEPERWLRLGDALVSGGEWEGALAAYEQADLLEARPVDVVVGISGVLIGRQEWEQAEGLLLDGWRQYGGDARLFNNLGIVAREQGDEESAGHYFSQAAELAPTWDVPQQNLAGLE